MYIEILIEYISEQGRDISEKIALGLAKPTLSKESMFDARLFNQTEGIGSGFKDEDGMYMYKTLSRSNTDNLDISLFNV